MKSAKVFFSLKRNSRREKMYLFLGHSNGFVFFEAKKIYLEMFLKPGVQKEDE
jgi:hypothetical protein